MNLIRTYRATTKGVRVHVRSKFEPRFSKPDQEHFIFSYHIVIENRTKRAIQVLNRNWLIFDSYGKLRRVNGRGVVGLQPEILPGQLFKYDSACDLSSTFGSMRGHYLVKSTTARPFKVAIPEFRLEVPWALS